MLLLETTDCIYVIAMTAALLLYLSLSNLIWKRCLQTVQESSLSWTSGGNPIWSLMSLLRYNTCLLGHPTAIIPHPLFFPSTIIGEPGTSVSSKQPHTASLEAQSLTSWINSLLSSTKLVIVHVGTNNAALKQFELTKREFKDLWMHLCKVCFYYQSYSNTVP